jgi:membrane protein DedA with SNARE-associated domain
VRRFLLFVFFSCTAASVAFSLWPRQLGGYLAMFGQHTSVNRGVAVTVLGVLTLLLAALRVRLWRSERDLAGARREMAQPPVLVYPPAPWGSRPAR